MKQILGSANSGKSLVLANEAAYHLDAGRKVAIVPTETANRGYARLIKPFVDKQDNLTNLFVAPNDGATVKDVVRHLMNLQQYDVVLVDSCFPTDPHSLGASHETHLRLELFRSIESYQGYLLYTTFQTMRANGRKDIVVMDDLPQHSKVVREGEISSWVNMLSVLNQK